MEKICIFAGTTEGRALTEFLAGRPVRVTACVATEYGQVLLPEGENLEVLSGRLDEAEMEALLARGGYALVVDATHPYAPAVTENIARACGAADTPYLRLLREASPLPPDAVVVPNVAGAVEFLAGTQGNILLTTGSKELAGYGAIPGFAQRAYARVLPMVSSLAACRAAGLEPSHIIAMQGPFSQAMNAATLRSVSAAYLVTKDGGGAGGFAEKAAAARETGARLVVVGRPPQRAGLSLEETIEELCRRFGWLLAPRVTLVGIGPGCREAMTGQARRAIAEAACLIGARRMLEAAAVPGQDTFAATAPEVIAGFIRENPGRGPFAVVLSGDAGFFSGAKKLLPLLEGCGVEVLPGLSSLACLCARLKTSYEDVTVVSLHGRENDIVGEVRASRRVFALVGGENGAAALCRRLTEAGLGDVRVSVGQRLSYPGEQITVGPARDLSKGTYDSLSAVLIENSRAERVVTGGLPDEAFYRSAGEKGVIPMTKSEVRAVCLSKLRLTEDSVCWDVGAGTGSVAVEMARLARRGHVYAVERDESALAVLRENIRRFSLGNITAAAGGAPEACRELPAPTHVFVGGSGGHLAEILALALARNPRVRVVATAVTLESVSELTKHMKESCFTETEAVCLNVSRAREAGAYHLLSAQNPVYVFTLQAGPR